jgi:hypothetical protein
MFRASASNWQGRYLREDGVDLCSRRLTTDAEADGPHADLLWHAHGREHWRKLNLAEWHAEPVVAATLSSPASTSVPTAPTKEALSVFGKRYSG